MILWKVSLTWGRTSKVSPSQNKTIFSHISMGNTVTIFHSMAAKIQNCNVNSVQKNIGDSILNNITN